ncbi:hypothetical protein ABZZ17_38515 [Streptomyces sp. NPDC006512]|uniref:hypothetical protein n=1 Tax=Streptomyces sp. NPDC006512 TaxID=3154307 RepID=UPI0033B2CE2F
MTTGQLPIVWSLSAEDAQAGWRALWWNVGPDGELGVILVQDQNLRRSPYFKNWIGWHVTTTCDGLLIVVKDGHERRTTVHGINKSTGCLVLLSWSRFLLRGQSQEKNFVVYSPGGYPMNHISLGECTESIIGDRDGAIWTAHGDQGIYGDDPASRAGLARWNTDGDHTWTPQNLPVLPLGSKASATEGTLAWYAWYSPEGAFLTRVDPATGEETSWKNPVRDIDSLTVRGNRMILTHSFHNRPGIELNHAELINNTWVITTQEKLTLPEPMGYSCTQGRDGNLWLRSGDTWTRITL